MPPFAASWTRTLELPMRRRLIAAAVPVVLAAVAGAATIGSSPAAGDMAQASIVSEHPVEFTPHVLDGTVWALALVGDTVVVGGSFTKVAASTRRTTYARKNVFAYDIRDGSIRPFAPAVDGAVYSIAAGPDDTAYLGGAFKTIDGASERGLARVSVSNDGSRVSGFAAKINWGDV